MSLPFDIVEIIVGHDIKSIQVWPLLSRHYANLFAQHRDRVDKLLTVVSLTRATRYPIYSHFTYDVIASTADHSPVHHGYTYILATVHIKFRQYVGTPVGKWEIRRHTGSTMIGYFNGLLPRQLTIERVMSGVSGLMSGPTLGSNGPTLGSNEPTGDILSSIVVRWHGFAPGMIEPWTRLKLTVDMTTGASILAHWNMDLANTTFTATPPADDDLAIYDYFVKYAGEQHIDRCTRMSILGPYIRGVTSSGYAPCSQ